MERYTKFTKTFPLKCVSAMEVAKAFINYWVFTYGPPEELISDYGTCFTS